MDTLVRNMRILWRTERLLTELRLRRMMRRASLLALAAVLGLFAVGMLNVAGYVYLSPILDPTGAALLVAAVDAIIAAFLALAALPQKPGPEVQVLEDIRDMALADLESEAESVQADLRKVRGELEGMRRAVSSFARNPLDALNPQFLTAVASLLGDLLHRRKD